MLKQHHKHAKPLEPSTPKPSTLHHPTLQIPRNTEAPNPRVLQTGSVSAKVVSAPTGAGKPLV